MDETSLEDALYNNTLIYGGIVFTNSTYTDPVNLTKSIVYKIRLRAEQYAGTYGNTGKTPAGWLTNLMYPSRPTVGPRQGNDTHGGTSPGNMLIMMEGVNRVTYK